MTTPDIFSIGMEPGVSHEVRMLRLSSAHLAAQAIHAFVALGIADILTDEPADVEYLARVADLPPSGLYRLLRYLDTIDVVKRHEKTIFSLTPLGKTLRRQPTSALRDNALLVSSLPYWSAMGGLLQSLRTGENAFTHVCGRSFFEYLAEHAEFADVFNNAMTSSSRIAAGALLSAYDFSMFKRVVDIAGGQGEFMKAILAKCPSVHGVVYDRPAVVADADIPSVLANRFSVVTGNFFERIPEGADAYVLRRILHDWNDANALLILQNCRRAMTRESKLLIIELAPPEPGESGNNWAAQDLLMMLLMDGRERNAVDFHDLLSRAGFQIARTLRTNSPYWIVEVDPA